MNLNNTALILIGYQNDYFSKDGILHSVIEEATRVHGVLDNTLELLNKLAPTEVPLITTPIQFTSDYHELVEPIGILKTIKDVGAFKEGTSGSATIDEFSPYRGRIIEVPGKRGLNAFSNTDLEKILREHQIENIVLAGAVTSICIDSTGREAFERGYKVTQLTNCTSGRTLIEQEFYCENVFPLYAEVKTHNQVLAELI